MLASYRTGSMDSTLMSEFPLNLAQCPTRKDMCAPPLVYLHWWSTAPRCLACGLKGTYDLGVKPVPDIAQFFHKGRDFGPGTVNKEDHEEGRRLATPVLLLVPILM